MSSLPNKFEILRCLGQGSLGIVYLCRHPELPKREYAVKTLPEDSSQNETIVARLLNEFKNAMGVQHKNVIRHWEFSNTGDAAFLTMEYAERKDLADVMSQNGQLAIDQTVRIIAQICDGLQAIHDAGLIHRNIKAENILLTKNDTVKIADFCCSIRNGQKPDASIGISHSIQFISPECLINGQIDERFDIYALGCLAYELICGEMPFRPQSVYEAMTKRRPEDLIPIQLLKPSCPPKLEALVLKAMAYDVCDRYQSVREIARDLSEI